MSEDRIREIGDIAWRRVKRDHSTKLFTREAFYTPPAVIEAYETHLDEWLPQLCAAWDSGKMKVHACQTIEVPKAGNHIRPGAHLLLEDQVLYHMAAAELLPAVRPALKWSDGTIDCSYRLPATDTGRLFEKNTRAGWGDFDKATLAKLEGGAAYMVTSDIAGFYENIGTSRLRTTLDDLGVPEPLSQRISTLLNTWNHPRGRGIPQGVSASALLAKVYFDPIDHQIHTEGLSHLRFSDDIRVFCATPREARRAIATLTSVLRQFGLNLQTSKTKIVERVAAIAGVRTASAVVDRVNRDLTESLFHELVDGERYPDLEAIEEAVTDAASDLDHESIRTAFRAHFVSGEDQNFNKSLFHYLLNRLAVFDDRSAEEFCYKILVERPEETEFVLAYFARVSAGASEHASRLTALIRNDELEYDYQVHLAFEHLSRHGTDDANISGAALDVLRRGDVPPYVREHAIACLGRFGQPHEIELMIPKFAELTRGEQITFAASVKRLAPGKRRPLIARWSTSGPPISWAAALSK